MSKGKGLIRVVVVDDSAYNRQAITRFLEDSGEFVVAAAAHDGEEAVKKILEHRPDVVTLDLEMPVMDGFSVLRWLSANRPTPVVVVSSRDSDRNVFKALEFGAVDFVSKPSAKASPRLSEIRTELIRKVKAAAAVGTDRLRRRVDDLDKASRAEPAPPSPPEGSGAFGLMVIGASTGGPPAIQAILRSLRRLPVPVVVAQHMPPVFTRLFAERLDGSSGWKVKEAEAGELLDKGTVYIAPGGVQLELATTESDRFRIRLEPRRDGELYTPSVDRLFVSAARLGGARLLAVLLTGMGDDGKAGMREIKARGGRTLAESEETAVVYGMPGEAARAGLVDRILPLQSIASAIGEEFTRYG
jgi:two-component system chemotaxis response regulator CheB